MEQTTRDRIKALRVEAEQSGDLRLAMICVLALGGPDALAGAESGTEADELLAEGWTQDQAFEECERSIRDEDGEDDEAEHIAIHRAGHHAVSDPEPGCPLC